MYIVQAVAAILSVFVGHVHTQAPEKYSTWMLESIISRGEGIVSSDGLLGEIEKGIFQEALRGSIAASTNTSQLSAWSDYYYRSVQNGIGELLDPYEDSLAPLDRFSVGVSLLYQLADSRNETDFAAVQALRTSVDLQDRNANGGFWYFTDPPPPFVNYSNLSFADGMYSIAPFAVLYGQIFNDGNLNLNSSLEQVEIIYEHCKNASTGLVVHGYDASRQTPWANPITGASPIVWSRSLAWYTIGIVDALEIAIKRPLSILTPQYERLLALFQQLAAAEIAAINKSVQLTGRHGIWQVVDMPGEAGNFVEASGSSMIAYALAKGARLGFIPESNAINAACGVFQDVVENFVVLNANGTLDYTGTSALCTLETPDVNYEYYVTQPTSTNSLLGTGGFVLASLEMEWFGCSGRVSQH